MNIYLMTQFRIVGNHFNKWKRGNKNTVNKYRDMVILILMCHITDGCFLFMFLNGTIRNNFDSEVVILVDPSMELILISLLFIEDSRYYQ